MWRNISSQQQPLAHSASTSPPLDNRGCCDLKDFTGQSMLLDTSIQKLRNFAKIVLWARSFCCQEWELVVNYDPCGTRVPLHGLVAQRASPETHLKELEPDGCISGRALVRSVQVTQGLWLCAFL